MYRLGISLHLTNRLKQEILCWKYKLVYHLGKIRTHWHTKTAKSRTHWHTKKAEKDTLSSGMSLPYICPNLLPPPPPGPNSIPLGKTNPPPLPQPTNLPINFMPS